MTETIIIAALSVLCVVTILSLCLNLFIYVALSKQATHIEQIHAGLSSTLARVVGISSGMASLSNAFETFIETTHEMLDHFQMGGPMSAHRGMMNTSVDTMYRTMDGAYTAGTLEDLINKIKDAGEEGKYLKDMNSEFDDLRSMFEEEEEDEDNLF